MSALIHTTAFTEPVLSAIEPVLVDMGYTDCQNLNPEVPTTFSLITPSPKLAEAAGAMPGAIQQGQTNLTSGVQQRLRTRLPTRAPAPSLPRRLKL